MESEALKLYRFTSKIYTHSYAYVEWSTKKKEGQGEPRVYMCVHGLSRSSRDFDTIAQKIVAESERRNENCRVVCVDIVGRGKSDWLQDSTLYAYPTYTADMKDFIEYICEEYKVSQLNYIGTSMGGLISMFLFAGGAGKRIKKLVINDIGAILPMGAINYIKDNVGANLDGLRFASTQEAEKYFRRVSAGFGKLTDEQWANMATNSTVKTDDGTYRLHFDPRIFEPFLRIDKDIELWPAYNSIDVTTLLLHGVESGLLTNDIIEKMQQQGPGGRGQLEVVQVPNCGHAPALLDDFQCNAIIHFFFNT